MIRVLGFILYNLNLGYFMISNNMFDITCNAGFSMTRYDGVSNIIETQDRVVTNIITQSKYVTNPKKLL